MTHQYLERIVDLTDPSANHILNMTAEEARARIQQGPAEAVREIEGSFALVAKNGKIVRLARSLDRPMRYFLAKRQEGPALVVAHRIDAIWNWLKQEGFAAQFHPSHTRMLLSDLYRGAPKLGVGNADVTAMLARCGLAPG